jgi:hypothetical protein
LPTARKKVRKVKGDRLDIKRLDDGSLVFHEGDYIMIELRNRSTIPVYATVLDLDSGGNIGPLYPHPEVPGYGNMIENSGEWKRIEWPFVFRLGAPFGKDIFKVIATVEPVDFSPLLYIANTTKRGEEREILEKLPASANPIGLLLHNVCAGIRGSDLAGIAPACWGTSEVLFEVRPK